MRLHLLVAAVAAVPFAFTAYANAQDGDTDPRQELDPDAGETYNDGGLALEAGVDVTTGYWFRGILQEDQGFIIQPTATIGFEIGENDQFDIAGYVGIWNSFHDEQTGDSGDGNGSWYEADLYGGVRFDLDNTVSGLSADLFYTAYTSPNGAFDTVHEIAVGLGYEGSAPIPNTDSSFDFEVGVLVAKEISGAADGSNPGWYAELGIEPSYAFQIGDQDLTVGIPITLGFSIDDYYEGIDDDGNLDDETLGYGSVGVGVGAPLAFIPEKYGDWELTASVTALFLNDVLENINNDDDVEIIGTVGIAVAY